MGAKPTSKLLIVPPTLISEMVACKYTCVLSAPAKATAACSSSPTLEMMTEPSETVYLPSGAAHCGAAP